MATLLLVRHGRTTANATGVLAGRGEGVRLDELGHEQAQAVGSRLRGLPLAAVVSSPLVRCKETAREIVKLQPVPVPVTNERRLLECDYGSWTGRELKGLTKEPLWRTVQAHPSAAQFPDGESMAQMTARAVRAVRDWDAQIEDRSGAEAVWLAVSHGDVIKAVLADALGMHLDLFQRIVVDPGSLSVIRYTALRPFVVSMNTTAGDLGGLKASGRKRRRRSDSDAAVGGGAGSGAGGGAGGEDRRTPSRRRPHG